MKVHTDFNDFVAALNNNKVEYVIVESFALAYHGYPRATGDIDFWLRPTPPNVKALLKALYDFGFGESEISEGDIMSGNIIQLGYPPVRIDLMTILDSLTIKEIWESREKGKFADLELLGEKV